MTDVLWTAQEAADATGGRTTGGWVATGVAIDSRECAPGDLFVALPGSRFDGHDFVAQALAAGATAAMVTRVPDGVTTDAPLLIVDSVPAGLEALARHARARLAADARIVAVTGSVGKTSTKDALYRVLAAQARSHASQRSFNNHVGVPLSLARMPRETAFGVFELGMSQAGELLPLARLVHPDVAVITAIEAAHTAYLPNLEAIARAKAEVFQGLEGARIAVLPRDSAQFELLAELARAADVTRILTFGEHTEADAHALQFRLHDDCTCVSARVCGLDITYKVGIPGRHWVANSLAVLAAAVAVGADLGLAGLALAELSPLPGRGRRHHIDLGEDDLVVIDESYNASPASMRSALAVIAGSRPGRRGRRIAVLGEMLELGEHTSDEHRRLAEAVLEAGIDLVFTVGSGMASLARALPRERRAGHAETAEEAADLVTREVRPGDLVMVKGSNALGLSRVVDALIAMERPLPRRNHA